MSDESDGRYDHQIHLRFIGNLQNAPRTISAQFESDNMMHYLSGITHNCWSKWS